MNIICSSNTPQEQRHKFKELKLKLKSLGYPRNETMSFIKPYFDRNLKVYDKYFSIDNITCITTPSSSGYNPITSLFYDLLNQNYKQLNLINSDDFFNPVFSSEAKKNLNFSNRINMPITISERYPNSTKDFLSNISNNHKIILLEDWMSTGDSSILFSKFLNKSNIQINSIAALVTNNNYFCNNTEIRKTAENMLKYSDNKEMVCRSCFTLFDGFMSNKLNRFSLEFSRIRNVQRNNYIEKFIFSGCNNYLNSNLFDKDIINSKTNNLIELIDFRKSKNFLSFPP